MEKAKQMENAKQLENAKVVYEVIHQPKQNLFQTTVEGRMAFVQYRLLNGELDIVHTIVPRPLEGRGIASALVKAAYTYADEAGYGRKATCPYAVRWLERHPLTE